ELARHAAAALVARPLCSEGADDRLVLALQLADGAFQLAALVRVTEDLPGPEHALAQLEARLAELLLGDESFGVGGEVALEVRPAQLSGRVSASNSACCSRRSRLPARYGRGAWQGSF